MFLQVSCLCAARSLCCATRRVVLFPVFLLVAPREGFYAACRVVCLGLVVVLVPAPHASWCCAARKPFW
ncbi:hypothetical protein A2U01_0038017, partial [Trifolium medium]|nr:hypothetical protein [Trifolium medium]